MNILRISEVLFISLLGGVIASSISLPLPWVLGPLLFVVIWKTISKRDMIWPDFLKNSGLTILGIYFGLYFTFSSVQMIFPFLFPYVLLTIILIIICIMIGTLISKSFHIDQVTSVLSTIPGGLTEMVIASENLKANSSFVLIFQTIRLVTVLFTVPSVIIIFFHTSNPNREFVSQTNESFLHVELSLLWFIIPISIGFLLKEKIPAGIVLIPMLVTAFFNMSMIDLPTVPPLFVVLAQLSVGIGLGISISIKDIQKGGAYCIHFLIATLIIISISFGLGSILAFFTTMDYATAILSIAPGGLIEMALTASSVGADPAVVSSLQMIRILLIITLVPLALQWYFSHKSKRLKKCS
ncbi:AbrB family transcriptional regulator [Halalkalibacter hemicellulosilyticus]|uniref:Ammonia monooxygenase n=1 Tax=Halalkalibacter hemicellulosilyticusJCM 9152 TaxID=1236971 RepID=W4QGX4_9BACI|nr:AbrB family transcriptional regulator [Halalkalibacter hemicellulosilyticus]GAE30584.1 hypothetical protein JCM9152_1996 [Halalkalibacter hemicellulosilyticusJCM 9152]